MSETELSRSIQLALARIGAWAVRTPAGLYRGRSGGFVHVGEPGLPDLTLVFPSGFLEVKAEGGKLNQDQARWHEKAQKFGVRVATVRSVREAVSIVRKWMGD